MSDFETPLLIAGDAVETNGDGSARLIGARCGDCAALVFPPVRVCPECLSENVGRETLPSRGTLYSWSVVHVAPRGWSVPYIAGYVDLADGVRVFSHIVDADPDALAMDMDVALCLATLGDDGDGNPVASYAFAPMTKGGDDA